MKPRHAALAALALAAVIGAPALVDPTRLVLGHPRTDTWNHLWGYHHVATALAEGRSPMEAPLLRWPEGGTLWFVDSFGAALLAPVTLLGGPALAMNVAVLANLALAGWAAWLLAREVTGDPRAAAFAGVAFAATPQLVAQVHNGITETVAVGWLPLFAWALLRLGRDPTIGRGLAAGALFAVNAWANAYFGLFAAAIGLAWGLAQLRAPRRVRRALPAWGAAVVIALTLTIPAAALFSASLDAPDALVGRDAEFVWRSLVGHNMTDVVSFLRPGRHYSPDLKATLDDDLLVVVYIGWTLLVAATFGWRREPSRARPWLAGALVAFALALGPFLYVAGSYVRLGEHLVPLPFLAFFDLVPGLSRVSHAYRLAVPLGMCLSVLGALAFVGRPRLAGAAAAVLLAEVLLASPAPWPLPVTDASPPTWVVDVPQGGVLDLPVTSQVLARSKATYFQVFHGQGVPWGLNDPLPAALARNRLAAFLVRLEREPVDSLAPDVPWVDLDLGRRALLAEGWRTVVLHGDDYPAARRPVVERVLALLCGEGTPYGTDVRYDLGAQRL